MNISSIIPNFTGNKKALEGEAPKTLLGWARKYEKTIATVLITLFAWACKPEEEKPTKLPYKVNMGYNLGMYNVCDDYSELSPDLNGAAALTDEKFAEVRNDPLAQPDPRLICKKTSLAPNGLNNIVLGVRKQVDANGVLVPLNDTIEVLLSTWNNAVTDKDLINSTYRVVRTYE